MPGSLYLPTPNSQLQSPGKPYIHRDLSWLQFNERVLKEARTSSNPLLERIKFLAISSTNLDEFFMVRFASLGRSLLTANRPENPDGPRKRRSLIRIRNSILETVVTFSAKQAETLDILATELEAKGIRLIRQAREDEEAFKIGQEVFNAHVLPTLSPPEGVSLAWIQQLENVQMAALFQGDLGFKIPKGIPQVFIVPSASDKGGCDVFLLDDLLQSHLAGAFRLNPSMGILRATRDGDISVDLEEEDSASVPDIIRSNVGSREKGKFVRLQFAGNVPDAWIDRIVQSVRLRPGQIQPATTTLCLGGLWTMVGQMPEAMRNLPGLSLPPLHASVPPMLQNPAEIFDALKERDILLHHPYDSFEGYVNFIKAASEDPNVTMIQQSVYRTDALSPVVGILKNAAATKKVRVVIELRARFDELNNLRLADELRKAGVEVAFGFGKLKLHAKIALVTRQEGELTRYYTHLSTGNYNATTARLYEDLAILTANLDFGEDAARFFDSVLQGKVPTQFKSLIPAPARLHRKLIALIEQETQAAKNGEKSARIVAKMNALVDNAVIDKLYLASQSGVQVDLIVRGACSLIPGVKGLSDNIRVISVVDRFLEHSRIYYFANSQAMYLSSADWMPRNFFSRLELAFPVLDRRIYRFIEEVIIPAYLVDTQRGRELVPQGTWKKRTPSGLGARHRKYAQGLSVLSDSKSIRAQFLFESLAVRGYAGTPLVELSGPEKTTTPVSPTVSS